MRRRLLGGSAVACVLLCRCADTGERDTTPPAFSGLASATAISTTEILLSWEPATDDTTPTERIVYDICQSTTAGGCNELTVTYTTPPGVSEFTVAALTPATRYYFICRARDRGGSRDRNTSEVTVRTFALSTVRGIAIGANHSCSLMSDGQIKCWGRNTSYELGGYKGSYAASPVTVSGVDRGTGLAAGDGHNCVVLADGKVNCWGDNTYGQIGYGLAFTGPVPVTSVVDVDSAVSIAAGSRVSCAVTRDQQVMCWGVNDVGQLGSDASEDLKQCTQVPWPCSPKPASEPIPAGLPFSGPCACSAVPVVVPTRPGVSQVAMGAAHACALITDGTMDCWGSNAYGNLGDGTTVPRKNPVKVVGVDNVRSLCLGAFHTCALRTNGTVRCWGADEQGQRGGSGLNDAQAVASVPEIEEVQSIACGDAFTCAIVRGGKVRCWGSNREGQLGDGTTVSILQDDRVGFRLKIATVQDLADATAITAGGSHACMLLETGIVKCWGYNGFGQLGDGTTTNRTTPVQVVDLP